MLLPERIQEITYARNTYGPANCWTGTTGTLATFIDELLRERKELLERLADHSPRTFLAREGERE